MKIYQLIYKIYEDKEKHYIRINAESKEETLLEFEENITFKELLSIDETCVTDFYSVNMKQF